MKGHESRWISNKLKSEVKRMKDNPRKYTFNIYKESDNKLIADFIGDEGIPEYHLGWHMLMPVIKKMHETCLWKQYNIGEISCLIMSVDFWGTYQEILETIKEVSDEVD